jgi:transcription initiation factor TFIID subunit TAF12
MRTLHIKILDFEAMCRPSTRKDVHEAVVQHLSRLQKFAQTISQGVNHDTDQRQTQLQTRLQAAEGQRRDH